MSTASTPPAGGHPADTPPESRAPESVAPRRSDRSPWNWLLLLPIVVPLLVPLYNHRDPELGGWPFFYWIQLVFVAFGVLCTSVVYLSTRRSRGEREAAARAARDGGARA